MGHKLCLVVCRNFEKETAAVLAARGFEDVTPAWFPDHCHNSRVDWGALIAALQAAKADGREICLAGGGCLAARRDLPPELAALSLQSGGHCTNQFAGRSLTDSLIRQGAFLMTPGWLANWQGY